MIFHPIQISRDRSTILRFLNLYSGLVIAIEGSICIIHNGMCKLERHAIHLLD